LCVSAIIFVQRVDLKRHMHRLNMEVDIQSLFGLQVT
jgi:hypothetical protein